MTRNFFKLCMALLFLPLLQAAENRGHLRISDASGGAPMDAVKVLAMKFSRTEKTDVTISRTDGRKALQMLQDGQTDIVIAEASDIPKNFKGSRKLWAAEALVFHVAHSNPLNSLKADALKEIWQHERPAWNGYSGFSADIQRIAIVLNRNGKLEQRFLGQAVFSKNIFRVRDIEQAAVFLNQAGLICAAFRYNAPLELKTLQVNGILPEYRTIFSGEYPFSCRYELLMSPRAAAAAKKFTEQLDRSEIYNTLIDSGLIPAAVRQSEKGD